VIKYRMLNAYDVTKASNEAAIPPGEQGESLTIQSMADDCDINVIVKRFGLNGQLPETFRTPEYGDYSHITDFRSALHAVRDAQDEFMKLPPDLRAKFNNSPQAFLDAVASGEAVPALREAGLMPTPTPPMPTAPSAS